MGESSFSDDVQHRLDDMKGRIKEAAGALFDDRDLKRKGQIDQLAADIRKRGVEALDEVIDEAKTRAKSLLGDSKANKKT